MNEQEEKELYEKAINTWGLEKQSLMLIEEMAELTKAIIKCNRTKPPYGSPSDFVQNYNNLLEEIADVDIVLSQVKNAYKSEAIEKFKQEKLERLKKLVEG